ncbi:MAG: HAMP domain-containing protein, partial [Cyanobacteria bacterium P01_G01_bin.49]
FYRSSPRGLPKIIQLDSELMKEWKTLSQKTVNKENKFDANVDNVIYIAKPITLEGKEQGVFIAAHLTAGEKKEAFDAILIVSKVLLVGLIIAIILAWIATGKLLTPLKFLAKTVSNIGELALDQRISVEGKGEIAELAIAFNEMMNRLQFAFDSQRNFLNDAGHELRTPITIIQGHLELMGDDPQ